MKKTLIALAAMSAFAAAGYSYPFSKRTYVYTYAAYNEGKADLTAKLAGKPDTSGSLKVKDKVGEFGLGLVHSF